MSRFVHISPTIRLIFLSLAVILTGYCILRFVVFVIEGNEEALWI